MGIWFKEIFKVVEEYASVSLDSKILSNWRLLKNHRELGELIVDEITEVEIKIVKTMLQKEFGEEYKC